MLLTLLSPAGAEPVTLADMKAHLRVDRVADDAAIAAMLASAVRAIEARAGLALMTQKWRLTLDDIPHETVHLPIAPVTAVDAVRVAGETVDAARYETATGALGRVRPAAPWPAPNRAIGDIEIDFTAGAATAGDVPAPLKQAVMMLAAHFYEHRAAAGEGRVYSVPRSVDAILAPFRELRL